MNPQIKPGATVRRLHPADGSVQSCKPYGLRLTVVEVEDHRPGDGPPESNAVVRLSDGSWSFRWNLLADETPVFNHSWRDLFCRRCTASRAPSTEHEACPRTRPLPRVAWFARHDPTPRQLATLEYTELVRVPARRFVNADHVARMWRDARCDDLVVVAPLSLLEALTRDHGLHPLWPEMVTSHRRTDESEAQLPDGRWVGFVKWKRLLRVEKVFGEEVVF